MNEMGEMNKKQYDSIRSVQEQIGSQIARLGLKMGAIRLQPQEPFCWASGYFMPIYNDNRTFLQAPEARALIAEGFSLLKDALSFSPDWIAGTATAGIPHATTLADALRLPLCYVRGSSKTHGTKSAVEGLGNRREFDGETALLIEDLISTGGSSIRAVSTLTEMGAEVPYCFSIFTYGLQRAADAFMALSSPCTPISLLTYDRMISTARSLNYIDDDAYASLQEWRKDPFGWGEQRGFPRKEG